MNKNIFLDLDGVLCDWVRGVARLYGKSFTQEDICHWAHATELVGITDKQLWDDLADDDFWANLPLTKEFGFFMNLIQPVIEDVCILTSPGPFGGLSGKQRWIERHLPYFWDRKQYLVGPAKDWCAGPGKLLIDDSDSNIQTWRLQGGDGILVPRRWNDNADRDLQTHIEHNFNLWRSSVGSK